MSSETPEASRHVFISHASEDAKVATAVCAALEERGLSCWIAPRNVQPGAEYPLAIIDAISEAALVVLIFSRHANDSPNVKREIERAQHHGKPVLPVRTEPEAPSHALEYHLGSTQWFDAFPRPLEEYFDALAKAARSLMMHGALRAPLGSRRPASSSAVPRSSPGRRWAAILASAVLAAVGAGVGVWAYSSESVSEARRQAEENERRASTAEGSLADCNE